MWKFRNRRLAAIFVAIALSIGFGASPAPVAADANSVYVACKNATIGGKRKCIAAGQFCARRYEKDYNKYGYTCSKKDKNGRYHLKKL